MVEGNSDLTPQKLIGVFNPAKVMSEGFKKEYFEPGPLTKAMINGGLLYIEEFNRMPEETMNVLIRAAEDREIVIPRYGVVKAKPTFRIICAMNPYDDVGTGRISRALLDRFCRLKLTYQSRSEEIEIVRRKTRCNVKWLIELAVDLVRETRRHPLLKMGSSVRGAIDMVLIALKLSKLSGNIINYDILLDSAILGISSKIWCKDPSIDPETIIKEILDKLLTSKGVPKTFEVKIEGEKPDEEKFQEVNEQDQEVEKGMNASSEGKSVEERRKAEFNDFDSETLDMVRLYAKISPIRAYLLVRDRIGFEKYLSILEKATRIGNLKALETYAYMAPYLPEEVKRKAQNLALQLVVKVSASIAKGIKSGKTITVPFKWSYMDINIDKTIENILDHGYKGLDLLAVYEQAYKDYGFAVIIDRSASMAGYKITLAALVAATIAYACRNRRYSVLAFNTEVEFLKKFNDYVDVEELVDNILSLKAYGYTDIALGIVEAYKELKANNVSKTIGILITDGEWTAGDNPLKYAPLFDKLHVICVPSKWVGFARAIATKGHGSFHFITEFKSIIPALRKCLLEG